MRILITTSDAYVHLLKGFAHQWNKYCGLPVTVIWRNIKPPELPDNFDFIQAPSRWHDWSGSLLKALEQVEDEVVLLGLEDFWLSGPVDQEALDVCLAYMAARPEVDRIDLTEDRKAYPHIAQDGFYRAVIDPNAVQYICSSQFSLWRRDFLAYALQPGGELPPHFEVEGSRRVAPGYPVVLGAGFKPIPYSGDGVVWNGVLTNLHLEYLPVEDVLELQQAGCL